MSVLAITPTSSNYLENMYDIRIYTYNIVFLISVVYIGIYAYIYIYVYRTFVIYLIGFKLLRDSGVLRCTDDSARKIVVFDQA